MNSLQQHRSALKTAVQAVEDFAKGIVDTDGNPRDYTEDEQRQFDELVTKAEGARRALENAQRLADVKGFAATAEDEGEEADERKSRVKAAPKVDLGAVEKIGLMAMATAASRFIRRDTGEDAHRLKVLEDNGYGQFADRVHKDIKARMELVRTLNVSTAASGGFLTPTLMDANIIELLYPETSFLQGNPRRVNMPNGFWSAPRGATGSTASYTAEAQPFAKTEPTFDKIQLSAKKLGAIVPMTREMIDFTIPGVRAFVEADLREAMSQRLDTAAYFGSGANGEPLGILNHAGVQTYDSASADASPTIEEVDEDFRRPVLFMRKAFIPGRATWRWIMENRTLEYLRDVRTADGEVVYESVQGDAPSMRGIPIITSENVPDNLGTGGNETRFMLVAFREVFFGQMGGMEFATSDEASITINSNMVSAFENDLVLLRAIDYHDIGLRRPQAVVSVEKVLYGA